MTTIESLMINVREHIPLEQGLRLIFTTFIIIIICCSQRAYSIRTRIKTLKEASLRRRGVVVREHIPLEQGLRLESRSFKQVIEFRVREHIPLEQGLRLLRFLFARLLPPFVREHIPLEQGLRLVVATFFRELCKRQRAYSIRTRIKTRAILTDIEVIISQRAYSIRTRIKTDLRSVCAVELLSVREHIPLEQGLRHQLTYEIDFRYYTSESIFH